MGRASENTDAGYWDAAQLVGGLSIEIPDALRNGAYAVLDSFIQHLRAESKTSHGTQRMLLQLLSLT